jgi:hypothetical protein
MKRLAMVTAALVLSGCGTQSRTVRSPQADLSKIQRIVVMPFTDDPFVPSSGLKAAAFFRKAAQTKIKSVQWIGPTEVLKGEGIAVGSALNEDTVLDAPGAIEPVLGKIFASTETIKTLSPAREGEIAQKHQADAVLRGAVFYDPGTGTVESMITKKRATEAGVSIQLADARTGKVLLSFQQRPEEAHERMTANQLLRQTAEEAAAKIERSWK